MKRRFALLVCLLVLLALPLAAQTLTLQNSWTQTVTGQAQNVTTNSTQTMQSLNPNGSWNTNMPANGNTEEKIGFVQGSTYLANTPFIVVNVIKAQLVLNTQTNTISVHLYPATGGKKHEHDIEAANLFLAMKPPTKEVCLEVESLKGGKVLLANGLVLTQAGDLKLFPKEGKSGCVCGRGLAAKTGGMERFEAMRACPKK